jgi:hypothetical protein
MFVIRNEGLSGWVGRGLMAYLAGRLRAYVVPTSIQ